MSKLVTSKHTYKTIDGAMARLAKEGFSEAGIADVKTYVERDGIGAIDNGNPHSLVGATVELLDNGKYEVTIDKGRL